MAGLVLRLLLMPISLHPDLWGHSFTAYFFAYEGRWNIYDHLASLPPDHPLVKNFGVEDVFIYPPLAYYTLGLFRILVKPFTDPGFIPWLMENLDQVYSYSGLYRHLFFFKLPYLFIDLGLAWLLAGLFTQPKKKKLAFCLWLFNPLTLYASFLIGQLDLLPTFFTVLAVYLALKNRQEWALVSLGIGGSYKMFPLLLVPLAALILAKKLGRRLKLLALGFLPFLILAIPFLSSKAFRYMVLLTPKSQKMLFMGWPVSGAEVVYPFLLLLVVIYFLACYSKKRLSLAGSFLAVLLLVFSVTHYHPQWFLWVTPFLIWELVENKFKHLFLTLGLFLSWLVITLLFESSLSFGLFNPLWPALVQAPSLALFLNNYLDVFQFKSLVRSLFAGASLFLSWRLLSGSKNEN
jgi:hypothetical protein